MNESVPVGHLTCGKAVFASSSLSPMMPLSRRIASVTHTLRRWYAISAPRQGHRPAGEVETPGWIKASSCRPSLEPPGSGGHVISPPTNQPCVVVLPSSPLSPWPSGALFAHRRTAPWAACPLPGGKPTARPAPTSAVHAAHRRARSVARWGPVGGRRRTHIRPDRRDRGHEKAQCLPERSSSGCGGFKRKHWSPPFWPTPQPGDHVANVHSGTRPRSAVKLWARALGQESPPGSDAH